jgi:hypothetical protein
MTDQKRRTMMLVLGTVIMVLIYLAWDAFEGWQAQRKCVDAGGSWVASQEACLLNAEES